MTDYNHKQYMELFTVVKDSDQSIIDGYQASTIDDLNNTITTDGGNPADYDFNTLLISRFSKTDPTTKVKTDYVKYQVMATIKRS